MAATRSESAVSRRGLLVAGAGTAVGVATLAACGGGDGSQGGAKSGSTGGAGSSGGGAGGVLAKVSDIPVGGAVSATSSDDKPLIISQPSKGEIVGLSAICTHMGCTVAPDGASLACPCHGSTYDLNGENTGGPAPRPLDEFPVKVTGGEVVEA